MHGPLRSCFSSPRIHSAPSSSPGPSRSATRSASQSSHAEWKHSHASTPGAPTCTRPSPSALKIAGFDSTAMNSVENRGRGEPYPERPDAPADMKAFLACQLPQHLRLCDSCHIRPAAKMAVEDFAAGSTAEVHCTSPFQLVHTHRAARRSTHRASTRLTRIVFSRSPSKGVRCASWRGAGSTETAAAGGGAS